MPAEYTFHAIGTIHSPFEEIRQMPIQPAGAQGVRGKVCLAPCYSDGLADLEGFSHIILIYAFHRSRGFDLKVVPFLDTRERGLFATRAPRRPNPIGISVVELIAVQPPELIIANVDVLDGTPLLDIKPYAPQLDGARDIRTGWLTHKGGQAARHRSDDRFKDIPQGRKI
ncbi:MAG: tRNA (N6-threonylcarbamoyladenosine(37)-N6)-methyltransferase TrmO [Desulfobacterales bacterium]